MNEKVLVVDDDPRMMRLIEYILKEENYQILMASNGLQALRTARDENLDLIILDLMLPGVDGFEVCHRLREESSTANVPILVLSGKMEEKDKFEANKVGADVYLTKPVMSPELRSQVHDLLARKAAARQS